MERLRRRMANNMLLTSSRKRKIELFLNDCEMQDPDLVSFWDDNLPDVLDGQGDPKPAPPTQ